MVRLARCSSSTPRDSTRFRRPASLRDWRRYRVSGDIAGFDARSVIALYSPEPLPWDGLGAGPVEIHGSLRRKSELRLSANLAVTPASDSAPVHGQITARFDASSEVLDVGRSTFAQKSPNAEWHAPSRGGKSRDQPFDSFGIEMIVMIV